jgi:hypothetical protein
MMFTTFTTVPRAPNISTSKFALTDSYVELAIEKTQPFTIKLLDRISLEIAMYLPGVYFVVRAYVSCQSYNTCEAP